MHFVQGLSVGLGVGLVVGGYLAYKYADVLVAKAVTEYHKGKELEERLKKVI